MSRDIRTDIAELAIAPERLREIDPWHFERVVGELLAWHGWSINVTQERNDGGFDILGVSRDRSGLETSWLVECKRYVENKVGVETARSLLGVKTHLGIPNCVLVTTSKFTQGVRDLSDSRHDLHLVDYSKLIAWLQDYSPIVAEESGVIYSDRNSFSSCFVSHSTNDEEFVLRLCGRLRNAGIKVWYAPEDLNPGEKLAKQVKKAIRKFDRLLIVLSKESIRSQWVTTEINMALAREKLEGKRVLFPVSLVPIEKLRNWENIDVDTGMDIAKEIRSYYIPDFSDWESERKFAQQAEKVIFALQSTSRA